MDEGWRGQQAFAGLVFDLGEASGLLTQDQVRELKCSVERAFAQAFEGLEPVSYTHLDVYKRQGQPSPGGVGEAALPAALLRGLL